MATITDGKQFNKITLQFISELEKFDTNAFENIYIPGLISELKDVLYDLEEELIEYKDYE